MRRRRADAYPVGVRVLICDDEPDIRLLYRMAFEDLGAEVTKIEPRGGDPSRAFSGAQVWHRSKRSAELDLHDEGDRARRIGNFIAGMTDRYALIEHQRLFDSTPDLR